LPDSRFFYGGEDLSHVFWIVTPHSVMVGYRRLKVLGASIFWVSYPTGSRRELLSATNRTTAILLRVWSSHTI